MTTDKQDVLSKWAALKSPKGLAALAVAVLSALVGGAYMGDGFRIEFSTCESVEETPEAPEETSESPADPSAPVEPSDAPEAPSSPDGGTP